MSSKKKILVVGTVALAIGTILAAIVKFFSKGQNSSFADDEIEIILANSLRKDLGKKEKNRVKEYIKYLADKGEGKQAEDSLNFIKTEGAGWAKRLVAIYN